MRMAAPGRYQFEFLESTRETPTTSSYRFSTSGTGFRYLSNQAIRLILPRVQDPWGPARTFSLSSSPSEPDVAQVTVKRTASPYKVALDALTPGERVLALGPVGDLLYDRTRESLFIAGGIGVSPFRGMIRYASDTGDHARVVLLYSARSAREFAFKSELDEIARKDPRISIRYTVTRPAESGEPWEGPTGRIDARTVQIELERLVRPRVFVVGTPGMAIETLDMLRQRLGVAEADLEYEFFRGYRG